MEKEGCVRTPTVLWAQRPELLYITIEVPDVNKNTANVKVGNNRGRKEMK